jgi:membrane-associated protein
MPDILASGLDSAARSGGILDPSALLTGAGPWVLVVIVAFVFIETGLLFPFLPGDSLLFTAALLSAPLALPLSILIPAAAIAAVGGDQVGYLIGRRFGRRLFTPNARVLKSAYLHRTDEFFARHGAVALVIARFVPVVRTFIPPVVGMSNLPYRKFLLWNVVGGVGWVVVCVLAGVWLGRIPFVAGNVDLIAVGIVIVSLVPVAIEVLRARKTKA